MRLRSLLFVPGDRPDRMQKALLAGADAVILDLEDSVAVERKPYAREASAAFLRQAARARPLLVRVNALASGLVDDDLAALLPARPTGFVLPKAEGAASVEDLARRCSGIPVLPIATETPAAMFELGTYAKVRHLLMGLTWGAEDLSAAMGASSPRDEDGTYTAPYELARALTLFAGHAAEVPVIDTVFPALYDLEGLAAYARRARRDGFSGMLALHPSQVAVINDAFTPTPEEVRAAEEIVSAFSANPGAGALRVSGKMVDAPHLKQARRIIEMAQGLTR